MKRFWILFLVFVFAVSSFTIGYSEDAELIIDGNFEFSLNEAKDGLILIRYAGDDVTVSVPSMANDLPVTEIGDNAFYYKMNIKEIILPEGLISIGQNAFIMCSSLETVTIPDSVRSIGIACFLNCSALKEVHMSLGLEALNDYAFLNCTALEKLVFGSALKHIGQSAFQLCSSLKQITLPPAEQIEIGEGAFLDCPDDLEIIFLEYSASDTQELSN